MFYLRNSDVDRSWARHSSTLKVFVLRWAFVNVTPSADGEDHLVY